MVTPQFYFTQEGEPSMSLQIYIAFYGVENNGLLIYGLSQFSWL